jgi:transposase InsO family protein
VTAQLAREGILVNHKAVEAEMARQGLRGRSSRRKMRTTRRDPSKVPALDLVGRDFERVKLDELWIGDATYIWTDEGWLYLATVIDACSRRLLGWSITDHLRTELCLAAIEAAVATRGGRRRLVRGVVFHTDHGTQTGLNWSSQHLDDGGDAWVFENGSELFSCIGDRSPHRGDRRLRGVATGSHSGRRSLEA